MARLHGAQTHANAILDHVQKGTYPESEDVISADLPSDALPDILRLVKEARADLEVWLTLS